MSSQNEQDEQTRIDVAYVLKHLDVPFQFWYCDRCPRGRVEWSGDVATCLECGRTSEDDLRELGTVPTENGPCKP